MSKRDNLNEQFITVINNQLTTDIDNNTVYYYEQMLKQGMDEERAIELLAFFMEIFIKQNMRQENELNTDLWRKFLDGLVINYHISGEYEFDRRDERNDLKLIKKRYGQLKGEGEPFDEEIIEVESHLFTIHELFHLTANETKKVIHIVIRRLFDLESHETTDYRDYVHEDLLCLADGLEQICNPYVNKALYSYLSDFIDLEDPNQFDHLFRPVFLVLSLCLENIDKFEKRFGKDGYFCFISQYVVQGDEPSFFFDEDTLKK